MDAQHLKDTSKLPRWARDHIAGLESLVSHLRGRAEALEGGKQYEGTKVFAINHHTGHIPLPKGTRIRFLVGKDPTTDYIDIGFDPTQQGHGGLPTDLQLNSGYGRLASLPHVCNLIYVRVLE
jgi:hypothetical protein